MKRVSLLLLLLAVSVSQATIVMLGSDADTNVWNDGTNRGTANHMYLVGGAGRVGYVRFDLSALGTITIESASLKFTKVPSSNRNDTIVSGRFALVGLNNVAGNTPQDWAETTLTGNNAGDEYVGGGAEPIDLTKVTNLDKDDGVAVTETIVSGNATGGTVTVAGDALIAFLQSRVNDGGLTTFIAAFPGTVTNGYGLGTKENATEAYRPVLELTYTIPEPATMMILGLGSLFMVGRKYR